MPSRAKQQLIVLNRKDGKTKGTIIIVKKTGFLDLTINGHHYYYNTKGKNVDLSKVDINRIIEDVEAKEAKRRGVIVIRKK